MVDDYIRAIIVIDKYPTVAHLPFKLVDIPVATRTVVIFYTISSTREVAVLLEDDGGLPILGIVVEAVAHPCGAYPSLPCSVEVVSLVNIFVATRHCHCHHKCHHHHCELCKYSLHNLMFLMR